MSPERKGTRTHTVSVIALVHGFQSLFGSGLHAESFFFFFFPETPIGRVYFLPNVRTGTFLNVMLFK